MVALFVIWDTQIVPTAKSVPKKNDLIDFRKDATGPWQNATVVNRAGKATGKYKDWINIELQDGTQSSINLKDTDWKPSNLHTEEVNIVILPKSEHDNPGCLEAKLTELHKLKEFKTNVEVKDIGQIKISTT